MTEIIKIYKNEEDGIESHVAKIDNGFSVSLWDIDCGMAFPSILIYDNIEDAINKAKEII